MSSVSGPWEDQDENQYNPLQRQEQFLGLLREMGVKVLESDAGKRIGRFKRDMVLELFLRHGRFWEDIVAMRKRWDISASVQLVDANVWCPYPIDPEHWDPDTRDRWTRDVNALISRVVPEQYSGSGAAVADGWHFFVSACVLYDPPESSLIEFANFANPGPTTPLPARPEDEEAMGDGERRSMVAPPVRSEYHPRTGIQKYYIEVDPWTTEGDVRRGFSLIRQVQPRRQEGDASTRDPLVAIQCAILYDRHNARDPEDRRRKKWTEEKLAEKFGLSSARAAKEYIKKGRELLQDRL